MSPRTAIILAFIVMGCSGELRPVIESDGASLVISAGEGGDCRLVAGDGRSMVSVSELITAMEEIARLGAEVTRLSAELEASRASVNSLSNSALTETKASDRYLTKAGAAELYMSQKDGDLINEQIRAILTDLANVTATAEAFTLCDALTGGKNLAVRYSGADEAFLIPGAKASFDCAEGYALEDGATTAAVCKPGGVWSVDLLPECIKITTIGGSEATAGALCRAIYDTNTAAGAAVTSGTFWIKPPGSGPFEVFCDMETKAKDGGSGWTMCAKYDRSRSEFPRWRRVCARGGQPHGNEDGRRLLRRRAPSLGLNRLSPAHLGQR